MIEIYTDGSSRGNPGEGGYGIISLIDNTIDYYYSEKNNNVTNNQMELKAIIHALKIINKKYRNEECIIYSDSAYCVNICNDWIFSWAKNNWQNSKKEEVKNIDLIKELYELLKIDFPNFIIKKCSGHSNIIGNELADAIATNNLTKFTKIIKENDLYLNDKYYNLIFN